MDLWTVTLTIKDEGQSTRTLVITVSAVNTNDAFIIGASKAFAMFAGTQTGILGMTVAVVPPTP